MTDPRLVRPTWRGRTNVDALTIHVIETAEKAAGHPFVVTQGSYQSSVKASAGTHDLGGVVDLRWCGHDECIAHLRRAGLVAWHRTPAQSDWPHHVHGIVRGHPLLSASAARQVRDWEAGLNGLASRGRDDGPNVKIPIPVLPVPLTVVHASLHYSASARLVAAYMAALVREHSADLITATEAKGFGKVRATQKALGAGWAVRRRGEYMVAWRTAVLRRRDAPLVARLTYVNRGAARWRDLYVGTFPLEHLPTRTPLSVEVGHLAAGVEHGDKYRADPASALSVKTNRRGLLQWSRIIRPAGVVPILCFDANLDQKRDAWVEHLESRLSIPSIWRGRDPKRGTHGRRLIDTIHTTAPVKAAHVSPFNPPAPVDHRAIVARLEL